MRSTTFALAHKSNACVESYKKMATALGGITVYGKDTPIPLTRVLEVCGLDDAIWALRCTTEPSENIIIELACRCAEHTLHFYEDKYPDDKRPRLAIEAARVCIADKGAAARAARAAAGAAAGAARDAAGDAAAWAAAGAAARAAAAGAAAGAARDAAGAAAWAAAGAAARAAERKWQIRTFLELLEEVKYA